MGDLNSSKVTHLEDQIAKLGSSVERALLNVSRDMGQDILTTVRGRVPYLTGAARASYTASNTPTGVDLEFGGPQAPYVPWLEWGGRAGRTGAARPYVPGGRYLYPAIRRVTEDWEAEILRALDGLSDLEVT